MGLRITFDENVVNTVVVDIDVRDVLWLAAQAGYEPDDDETPEAFVNRLRAEMPASRAYRLWSDIRGDHAPTVSYVDHTVTDVATLPDPPNTPQRYPDLPGTPDGVAGHQVGKRDPDRLVGHAEIARMARVSTAAVTNWVERHEDFPVPVTRLAMGPVYRATEVYDWLVATGRRPVTE